MYWGSFCSSAKEGGASEAIFMAIWQPTSASCRRVRASTPHGLMVDARGAI